MRRNILIIDDAADLRELMYVILGQAGFTVKGVEDGFSAYDELHANRYDLVLLDISMPHMSGFKVLNAIRNSRRLANVPVIMLTASAEKEHLIKIQDAIDDYIIKPPNRADLLARIERVLGGRPQFEEVQFGGADAAATGSFDFPLRLKSISSNGLSFYSPMPLEKGTRLPGLAFAVLADARFKLADLNVAECVPLTGGGFQCFVSFAKLSSGDRERIRDWVIAKTYKARSERASG